MNNLESINEETPKIISNEDKTSPKKQGSLLEKPFSSINSDYIGRTLDATVDDDAPLIIPNKKKSDFEGIDNVSFRTGIDSDEVQEKLPLPGDVHVFDDKPKEPILPVIKSDGTPKEKFRVTVEPAMICIMLGIAFQGASSASLIMFMTCHVAFNHSDVECLNQSSAASTSSQVQSMTADINLYKSFVEVIPAMILTFFMGSWSDKHGRKIPIILPVFGFTLSAGLSLMASLVPNLPPLFVLLPSSIMGLTGNMSCFMLGVFSYMSDISSVKTRTLRIAIVDLSLVSGLGLGIFLSSVLYTEWGFVPSFGVALGLFVLALIYLIFFTKESVKKNPGEESGNSVKQIFHIRNILETIKVCLKRRSGNQRGYIMALIAALCIMLFPFVGENSITLLYVSKKFSWNQSDLGYFSAYGIVISIIGATVLFRFVIKRLHISDLLIGLVGLSGFVLKALFMALSDKWWELYIGSTLAFFQPLALPVSRSLLTKIVSSGEQGKIYALMTSCETVIPLFATTIYTQIYKATQSVFPGAAFLFTASAMIIPMICFSWIYIDMRRKQLTFNELAAQNRQEEDLENVPYVPDLSPKTV